MLLWILFGVVTAAVLAALLRPLMRRGLESGERASHDVAVFRDQLAELDREAERGLITAAEAASARIEIQRRLLAVANTAAAPRSTAPARAIALGVALFVPLAALVLYLELGSPDVPDQPLASRGAERQLLARDGSLDLEKARAAIVARVAQEPNSLEGWMLLGRTDAALAHWQDAHADFDKALALSGRSADTLQAYGRTLVAEGQGAVSPQAVSLFREAAEKDPKSYEARYELARARAEGGDYAGAIADWQALLAAAPSDAEWLPTVRDAIQSAERARSGGGGAEPPPATAPSGGPPPEVAAIMKLPASERGDAIRGMVAGLAAKLESNPNDLDGWTRLGRSYLVLGEPAKSADAYGKAMALAPRNADLALGRAQALRSLAGEDAPLTQETVEAYQKVVALAPNQPEALWYLGQAAKQHGDTVEAARDWNQLLGQLPPDAPETAEIRKQLAALSPAAPATP